jgi:hypothetical protein
MALMRHTDVKLTMRYYTDPRLLDTAKAVEGLPELTAEEGRAATPPADGSATDAA